MASLQWGILLDTCCRRKGSDILLSPGAPPMIRLEESWRSLQVPPLDAATIQALASKQLGENPDGREQGYAYSDFSHVEGTCNPLPNPHITRFRATAFGYPATSFLLISRYSNDGSDGNEAAPRRGF